MTYNRRCRKHTCCVFDTCLIIYCMLYDSIMDKNQDHEKMLREMLYDVVSEVCNQMKELRNELVELQHAIYTINDSANNQVNYQVKKSADKLFIQETLL